MSHVEVTKRSLSVEPSLRVKIIKRTELAALKQMQVEGVETYLGEVRNFKNDPFLKENLPHDLSISWTMLPKGGELDAHFHPCSSTIIVANGEGRSTGDTCLAIAGGDVIHIPEWNSHGFVGEGQSGFHALSIQFQPTAIFESADTPETTYQQRLSIPLEERQLNVTKRDELPSIHEVEVDGVVKQLGILKNFSESTLLKEKFPNFFSCAWVHLNEGEVLDTHTHDCPSMIILTEGKGFLKGDCEREIEFGDSIYVEAGAKHGFVGAKGGFWALSIQFEKESLYQGKPRVQFTSAFNDLMNKGDRLAKEFMINPIFELTQKELSLGSSKREAFMDGLQVMSDHFQRLMFARQALCDSNSYAPIFLEHFLEELGHDTDLKSERGKGDSRPWDPCLEATAGWFVGKNYLIDNPARVVMIHMVLERGASLFYSHFADILGASTASEHISKHCDADEGHDKLGLDLLEEESEKKLASYEVLLEQSWSMLNLFLSRLAENVARKGVPSYLTLH